MGELWGLAQQLGAQEDRAKAWERENEQRWAAARQLSEQRAAEFIAHMREHDVPTLPLVARQVEHRGWGNAPKYFGYHPVGRGWVVQERNGDPDHMLPGMFLLEDGQTYETWDLRTASVVSGLSTPPEVPFLETSQDQIKGREHEFPAPMQIPYATDAGALMLAGALRRVPGI